MADRPELKDGIASQGCGPTGAASPSVADQCIACGRAFVTSDLVLHDYNGGLTHAACTGPERECFVDLDTGDPIGPDEPLPKPFRYGDGSGGQAAKCPTCGEDYRLAWIGFDPPEPYGDVCGCPDPVLAEAREEKAAEDAPALAALQAEGKSNG